MSTTDNILQLYAKEGVTIENCDKYKRRLEAVKTGNALQSEAKTQALNAIKSVIDKANNDMDDHLMRSWLVNIMRVIECRPSVDDKYSHVINDICNEIGGTVSMTLNYIENGYLKNG